MEKYNQDRYSKLLTEFSSSYPFSPEGVSSFRNLVNYLKETGKDFDGEKTHHEIERMWTETLHLRGMDFALLSLNKPKIPFTEKYKRFQKLKKESVFTGELESICIG
ncbi:hypothetical protein CL617_03575 [archaeon]|nr:hypothetical protein [archaeon]|tara:strand:+ start:6569 stop:6889 length:321 start_codon:yes stop_codon:yes gene_type:complete